MRMLHFTKTLFFLLAICWTLVVGADVGIPPLSGRVIDLTATLSAAQKNTLEQTLQNFEAKKGSQIAVLIISSTAPETIEQYSMRVVEQWKLGRNKIDDGVLLIVAKNDRTLRIEVGYGLEGTLNDATSKRIISEIITPKFKRGDFYGGINDGLNSMMRVIDGEPLPASARRTNNGINPSTLEAIIPVIFILVLAVGSFLRSLLGKFLGAIATGGLTALVAWVFVGTIFSALLIGVLALLFTLFGESMGGLIGRRYGGKFGGRSGGGFSGGGGGFGGGGASGRW